MAKEKAARRTKVKELARSKKELGKSEQEQVKGGNQPTIQADGIKLQLINQFKDPHPTDINNPK